MTGFVVAVERLLLLLGRKERRNVRHVLADTRDVAHLLAVPTGRRQLRFKNDDGSPLF